MLDLLRVLITHPAFWAGAIMGFCFMTCGVMVGAAALAASRGRHSDLGGCDNA